MSLSFLLLVGRFLANPLFFGISAVVSAGWGRDILYTFAILLMLQCVNALPRLWRYKLNLQYGLIEASPDAWEWAALEAFLGICLGTIVFIPIYATSTPIWQAEWGNVGAVLFYFVYIRVIQWEFGRPEEWKRLTGPEWERTKEIAKRIRVKPPRVTVAESPIRREAWAVFFAWSFFERIYLSRPLLDQLTPAEVDAVLAHELAHKRYEIIQVLLFYLVWIVPATIAVYAGLPRLAGALGLGQGVERLPLFMFLIEGTLLLIKPLTNAASRWIERKADRLALSVIGDREAFAGAMIKLHDHNLIFAAPGRVWQVFFGTHPAGVERVCAARAFRRTSIKLRRPAQMGNLYEERIDHKIERRR